MSDEAANKTHPAALPVPSEFSGTLSAHPESSGTHAAHTSSVFALALGAIGVVYGDIGTSPIYAFRESLHASHHAADRPTIIGVISLIVWALLVVVTLKYVIILLRADNEGEGGTLSLAALSRKIQGRIGKIAFGLGVVGAALFLGDAAITPAISILSAVEGVMLIAPWFEPYVLPSTLLIIVGLFFFQRHGTEKIAFIFGPILVLWFSVLGLVGAINLFQNLSILAALNPIHGLMFLFNGGEQSLLTLGGAFLALTGAEALYADLGHFGRKPISRAWLVLVFPTLILNYLGQGALVLNNPSAAQNPFFGMFPSWALIPIVILATIATIIASQAVITGAYSLMNQAVRLRLLPLLKVKHTSDKLAGQIYMPQVNLLLACLVVGFVLTFRSSSALATAYGLAVSGQMLITGILVSIIMVQLWKWPLWPVLLLMVPFGLLDSVFLTVNMFKFLDGGYATFLLACLVLILMRTWIKGSAVVLEKTRKNEIPMSLLLESLQRSPLNSVHGVGVYLTADPAYAPTCLLHTVKHFRTLHEKTVILSILTDTRPRVPDSERVRIEVMDEQFSRIFMSFGYMEIPNIPQGLKVCRKLGWKYDIMTTSFCLSRRSIIMGSRRETQEYRQSMTPWQANLFIIMADNASNATNYFRLPTDRVVEIGVQVGI